MFKSEKIRTKDGKKIGIRMYAPNVDNGRVIIISPSAGVTQDFYFDFACFFQQKNFAVITYDFRGMGNSAPGELKGYGANLEHWALQDTDAVLLSAKNLFPKHELIFIGHGIGGEIIGLAPASQFINRLVLVSCALSCSRLCRWRDKIWMEGMKEFAKIMSWFFGYFPGKLFGGLNNLPKGVMYEWIHWCNNANGLFDDFPDHNYRKLQVPLMAFSFSDDWRSQECGLKALLEHFTSASITWHHFKPKHIDRRRIGHLGFFKYTSKKNLWNFLLQWMIDEKTNEPGQLSLTIKPFLNGNSKKIT
jgi:predicted alpha/beta hydrolase